VAGDRWREKGKSQIKIQKAALPIKFTVVTNLIPAIKTIHLTEGQRVDDN
jgi:hypothetical protein